MSKPKPPHRLMLDIQGWRNETSTLTAAERGRGLEVPCERIEALDRDGNPCRPGVYRRTTADRAKLNRWVAQREAGQHGFVTPMAAWPVVIAPPAATCATALLRFLGWA